MTEQTKSGYNTHYYAEIAKLKEELEAAKAERDEYKKVYEALDNACLSWHFPCSLSNPDESINELLKITDAVRRDTQINKDAEKFALEKQIKALELCLETYITKKFYPSNYAIQAFSSGVNHLWTHVENQISQLRKQQAEQGK